MAQVVLIGVGQATNRADNVEQFIAPFDFMARVAQEAAEDAGSPSLLSRVDSVHVVNMFSWVAKDAPTSLAERLGMDSPVREYSAMGGNSPQALVLRVADRFARGEGKLALIAGCEVMHSLRLAGKAGVDLGAFRESVAVPLVGTQREGTLPVELAHQADLPMRIYPLLETALRAKLGLTIEQHRQRLGHWGQAFSAVASQNPHSWTRTARTANEIMTPTPRNRMLGYPYTRLLNSELYVDQAAALLLATPEMARDLGVPESKWVYLHGGQEAYDHWFVSHRPDLADSPAIRACVDATLRQAERSLDDVSFFDLYSCFPVMPFLTQQVLGLSDNDPRPRTVTGGLPFFGGPGNNYVTHAIAEAVLRCRAEPGKFGLVTANGYYATKHAFGLYSTTPPSQPWARTPAEDFQKSLPLGPEMEIDLEPAGDFIVDGYTVWHDRDGQPEYSILVGKTASGKRAWGTTPRDPSLLTAMEKEEWVGKRGRVKERAGSANVIEFT